MMIKSRKEIKAKTISQENDCSCFRAPYKSASKKNKRAKRHSNRILRRIIKEEIRAEKE